MSAMQGCRESLIDVTHPAVNHVFKKGPGEEAAQENRGGNDHKCDIRIASDYSQPRRNGPLIWPSPRTTDHSRRCSDGFQLSVATSTRRFRALLSAFR